ncbi:MAG: hypothetical protein MH472_05390 [Bacteroidia bacterium]|nr:hypothetical protein [Bacteroidia bacterium]
MAFRRFFFLFLLIQATFGFAQVVEWGNPQKIKQKNIYSQIVGEASHGIYVLRCKSQDFSRDVLLEKYKLNLNLEASVPAPISINGNIERALLINNDLYFFISAKNTVTGNIDILAQKIDPSLKPAGLPNVIASFPASQFIEKRKFQIKTSADKKRVLIMFLSKGDQSGESRLNLFAYDESVQQTFGKQFLLNEKPDDIFLTNFEIDNKGNAFVLIDFPAKNPNAQTDNRDFFLYSYYPQDDKMLAYQLANEKVFVEELAMVVNNFNQTVTVTGLYSGENGNMVNGYFLERFSISKKSTEEKFAATLDASMLTHITGGKIEKRNPDLKNYFIRKLIARSDGGVIVVAEKYTRTEQRYSYYMNNMPQEGVRISYNYDDVAILSINKDGSIQFGDLIRKRQSSVGDGGYISGIACLPTQDFIYVLYNSELDKDGNIMSHFVNYMGKSDEKIAVKSSSFSVSLIPSDLKQTGANTFLGSTIRDKQYTLIRLTF